MNQPILEIHLEQGTGGTFQAALHMWLPSRSEQTFARAVPLALDLDQLRALGLQDNEYGQALTAMVFRDRGLRENWRQALGTLYALTPIRLRISYSPDADELHGVRWELLQDPLSPIPEPLALNKHFLFSRYLEGTHQEALRKHPPGRLGALVVIASPRGLEQYNLAPIDGKREAELVRQALVGIDVTELRTGLADHPVTIEAVGQALRQGRELVYLLAHGRQADGDTRLWLEDDTGATELVSARDIVHVIRSLRSPPLLIVLASCYSAGDDSGGALVALGSQLVLAGVPAVVAAHGRIRHSTLQALLPRFFQELRRHGQIDQALAVARSAVRRQTGEWWRPVLFLGIHGGRLWPSAALRAIDASVRGPAARDTSAPGSGTELDQIAPGQLLQIGTDALCVEAVYPVRHSSGVTVRTMTARDSMLDRQVLIQVFQADPGNGESQQTVSTFRHNARLHEAAAHRCPHLPRTYAARSDDLSLWLVREWIDGIPLLELYPPDAPLPTAPMIALMSQTCLAVCDALAALQAEGLRQAVVAPTLIVRQRAGTGAKSRGVVLLDPAYGADGDRTSAADNVWAPEQLRPQPLSQAPSPPTAVYQLGAILYALITHVRPDLLDQQPAPPARSFNPAVPEDLEVVLTRALAVNPRDRYPRAADFSDALRETIRFQQGR